MADELKDQRIPIMMSPSEVKAIDDWMFNNRKRSRADTIRYFVRCGLVYDELAAKNDAADKLIDSLLRNTVTDKLVKDWLDKTKTYVEKLEIQTRLTDEYGDELELQLRNVVEAMKVKLDDGRLREEERSYFEKALENAKAVLSDVGRLDKT